MPVTRSSSVHTGANSTFRENLRVAFNTLGYALAKKDKGTFDCPSVPLPSDEMVETAQRTFRNCFEISPSCDMNDEEIEAKLKEYCWHYPFKFGDHLVEADEVHLQGLRGRSYQRYCHIFPTILTMMGGSLAGKTVLDVGCNAGFWLIQAMRAGASKALGIEGSPEYVDQAKFILKLTGMDGIDYRVMNAYDIGRESTGDFDVTFFLGLLYHLDKPILALERLFEVTKEIAVVDTTVARADVPANIPILKLEDDIAPGQYFSNKVAFSPTKSAVPRMMKHVGFREVFWIKNATKNLPLDYLTGARISFVGMK